MTVGMFLAASGRLGDLLYACDLQPKSVCQLNVTLGAAEQSSCGSVDSGWSSSRILPLDSVRRESHLTCVVDWPVLA